MHALTMGIRSILLSHKIILLASGAGKHKVVKELLHGGINTAVPATMLKVHRDVTLICDKAAYSGMKIGVDIGGTDIKFGVLNDQGELVYKDKIPTEKSSAMALVNSVAESCLKIADKLPISAIGVGTPGLITNDKVSATNLPFKNFPLASELEKLIGIPVSVCNDATCAALGENIAGSGKGAKNLILITLGTGIGGGIIINGAVYEGNGNAGEIGHMCVCHGGKPCSCGRKGCWEQYASVSALMDMAKKAATASPDSLLGRLYTEKSTMSGEVFFEAYEQKCPKASAVFDEYITWLAEGINTLISIFAPDMIVISGGISAVGTVLTKPLSDKVSAQIPIKTSILQNDAGIIGAASL